MPKTPPLNVEPLPPELSALTRYAAQSSGRIVVGFSGGLDSSVLLTGLVRAGYGDKVLAVHVHHGLSAEADSWQGHCAAVCAALAVEFVVERVSLTESEPKSGAQRSLEMRARDARRYALLRHVSAEDQLWLAHHRDDQAETLMLRLMRGAGSRGLGGMREHSLWRGRPLCRPLLAVSRAELESIGESWNLAWIEDPSNQDGRFDRNFLRHHVLPALTSRWPAAASRLGAAAHRLSEDAVLLEELAALDFHDCDGRANTLDWQRLQALSAERQRNVLRGWLNRAEILPPSAKVLQRVLSEVLTAADDKEPRVAWPHGVFTRFRQRLFLLSPQAFMTPPSACNWYPPSEPVLTFGGWQLRLADDGQDAQALSIPVTGPLTIRVAAGGERIFWRGMHRQVSELWRQQGVPTWQRKQLPLIFHGDQLIAAAAIGVADDCQPTSTQAVWQLSICAEIADFAL